MEGAKPGTTNGGSGGTAPTGAALIDGSGVHFYSIEPNPGTPKNDGTLGGSHVVPNIQQNGDGFHSVLQGAVSASVSDGLSVHVAGPSTASDVHLKSDGSPPGSSILAHFDSPMLFAPVASVVSDPQPLAVARGDAGASPNFNDGEIARGSDLAPLALNLPDFTDHGWFIVPSASNEYGNVHVAGDGFVFDVAIGEFTGDWFLV